MVSLWNYVFRRQHGIANQLPLSTYLYQDVSSRSDPTSCGLKERNENQRSTPSPSLRVSKATRKSGILQNRLSGLASYMFTSRSLRQIRRRLTSYKILLYSGPTFCHKSQSQQLYGKEGVLENYSSSYSKGNSIKKNSAPSSLIALYSRCPPDLQIKTFGE